MSVKAIIKWLPSFLEGHVCICECGLMHLTPQPESWEEKGGGGNRCEAGWWLDRWPLEVLADAAEPGPLRVSS